MVQYHLASADVAYAVSAASCFGSLVLRSGSLVLRSAYLYGAFVVAAAASGRCQLPLALVGELALNLHATKLKLELPRAMSASTSLSRRMASRYPSSATALSQREWRSPRYFLQAKNEERERMKKAPSVVFSGLNLIASCSGNTEAQEARSLLFSTLSLLFSSPSHLHCNPI